MKLFISWSGDRSKAIAEILRGWFPSVLQAVRPYFSPDDIAKGSRWNSEIAKELEASRIGILVITNENQDAPWLLFEAGALAKNLDSSKVCPILFGELEPTDLKGPLVQFQAASFKPDDMKRLVKMINSELAEAALSPDVLDSVFDMWWPRLENQVTQELQKQETSTKKTTRTDRDILEEILALTRRKAGDGQTRRALPNPRAVADLARSIGDLAGVIQTQPFDEAVARAFFRLLRPVEYLARKGFGGFDEESSSYAQVAIEKLLEDGRAMGYLMEPTTESSP